MVGFIPTGRRASIQAPWIVRSRGYRAPSPLGPLGLDLTHPLTAGIDLVYVLRGEGTFRPLYLSQAQTAAPNLLNGTGFPGIGPQGGGLTGTDATSGMKVGFGNFLYTCPQSAGSCFALATAGFAPTDGLNHQVCQISAVSVGCIDILKDSSNNLLGGWRKLFSTDARASVAASGLWSSGETFTIGTTWTTATCTLFTKGAQRANSGVAPLTSDSSGNGAELGNNQNFNVGWARDTASYIYWLAIWNRVLSLGEIAWIEAEPWSIFRPMTPRLWAPSIASAPGLQVALISA